MIKKLVTKAKVPIKWTKQWSFADDVSFVSLSVQSLALPLVCSHLLTTFVSVLLLLVSAVVSSGFGSFTKTELGVGATDGGARSDNKSPSGVAQSHTSLVY